MMILIKHKFITFEGYACPMHVIQWLHALFMCLQSMLYGP